MSLIQIYVLLHMAAQNIKHSDIAAQLNISLRTVQNVLKEHNLSRDYTYHNNQLKISNSAA